MTDRAADAATPHTVPPPQRGGGDALSRALRRARWTIFWERLWPALASIATVLGLSVCRISQIRTAALAKLRVALSELRAA